MSGPVVVVTGGAGGIGSAVVRRCLARGCRVHVLDLAPAADGESHLVDVRDPVALGAAVTAVVEREGGLDHVVAAAAVVEGGSAVWETDPAVAERLWQTDALGIWHTATATVPHLLAAGRTPSFVAITSSAGEQGLFHVGAYVVAKHAAVGVVRALAADLIGTHVVACGVAPGATDTAMLAATAELYGVAPADLAADQYQHRPLTPDEVAAVVEATLFAGPAVHGAILSARGGAR